MKWVMALLLLVGCARVSQNESGKKEYQEALQTKTIFDRKSGLNSALDRLFKTSPSSAVYQNTAQILDLLGETPQGIYYAYQALKTDPRNAAIGMQLDEMLKRAQLPPRAKQNPFGPLIRWHQALSTGERFLLLFFSLIAFFVLSSLKIWRENKALVPLIGLAAASSVLFAGSLLYSRYGASLEGVLVKPAALYREPSTAANLVKDVPLPAGLKLEVLDEKEDGEWLKVKTEQGEYGYVGYRAIRLVTP